MAAPVFPRTVDLGPREVTNRLTPVLRQRVRAWIAAGAPPAGDKPGRAGIEALPSLRKAPPARESGGGPASKGTSA